LVHRRISHHTDSQVLPTIDSFSTGFTMDIVRAFLSGALAGYAIAIPVGAIGILIIDSALRRGFRIGFAAGSGAASADFVYAAIVAFAGAIVAPLILPLAVPLKIASGFALIALGAYGLWKLRATYRHPPDAQTSPQVDIEHGALRTYQQFLALTLLNPATFIYFTSLILGGSGGVLTSAADRIAFVIGAALASWSWQSLLAVFGILARHGLPPRARIATSVIGNLIVAGLGVNILVHTLV
jgi:arginine exporter protein ArgO